MMFNEVLALDDAMLLLALRRTLCATQQCEHYYVLHDTFETQEPYVWDGATQRPWNPLHDWRDTMALAWRYRIGVWPVHGVEQDGEWRDRSWLIQNPYDCQALGCISEEDARRQICRLALWAALAEQQQEVPHAQT